MNKSIIAWVGGKSKLMWLINLLAPPEYERSVDVFGGSGTVTLNLDIPKGKTRIYNDACNNLTNLLRCAKEDPRALTEELGFLPLNSRDDFEILKKSLEKDEFSDADLQKEMALTEVLFKQPECEEILEILRERAEEKEIRRAATYYKVLRYSFNANGETYGGRSCDIRRFFGDIWAFSRAFADVVIENKDFESLIKQYDRPDAFIYCDPPYFDAESFYEKVFPSTDHRRLHDTLTRADGYVMVSYNHAPEILELYQDFYIFYTTRPNSMSQKEGALYEELIMTNYDPRLFLESKNFQINLFDKRLERPPDGNYRLIHEPTKALKQHKEKRK